MASPAPTSDGRPTRSSGDEGAVVVGLHRLDRLRLLGGQLEVGGDRGEVDWFGELTIAGGVPFMGLGRTAS
ncbi:MAG: hypothetical protein ACXWDM_14425 [Nocardioides sp.]